jgi:hypothetical protein
MSAASVAYDIPEPLAPMTRAEQAQDGGSMRIWVQVFSARERNPDFHATLGEHLRAVVEPGVQIEVHGTRKGGLGEQFRFFQAIDTPDIWKTF